jgi:hypothetical protein
VPTRTGDDLIAETIATRKHACVAKRARMLKGEPAREQWFIIENVNFLNNADLEGKALPPPAAPNIMMAPAGRDASGRCRHGARSASSMPGRTVTAGWLSGGT